MDSGGDDFVTFEDNDGNAMNEAEYDFYCSLGDYIKEHDVTGNDR